MTTRLIVATCLAGLVVAGATVTDIRTHAQSVSPAWSASLEDIRRTATLIPGRRPLRLNTLKFAESRRTKNFSVKGAPTIPSVQARTAFQAMYADGSVMIDAGTTWPSTSSSGEVSTSRISRMPRSRSIGHFREPD